MSSSTRITAPTKPAARLTIQPKPLLARPLSLLYIAWFTLHLATALLIDLQPLYSASIHNLLPKALRDVRAQYIADYQDPLALAPPPWFGPFLWVEAVYQVPLCAWGVRALVNDDPSAPVHFLVYAVQTALSTLTCLLEIFGSGMIGWEQKVSLAWLYIGFAVVPALLGCDMFLRIRRVLVRQGDANGDEEGKAGKRD